MKDSSLTVKLSVISNSLNYKEYKMRSLTFEIILDQLKHKHDQELAILIEQQKQETLQSKLIVKNQEIDELKRTQAGFQKKIPLTAIN